jgi:hypothetical protein
MAFEKWQETAAQMAEQHFDIQTINVRSA